MRYTAVVACHNASRTLGHTLSAIERLQPRPKQIIVVDDGSADSSAEIAGGHQSVSLIRFEKNRGASAARNEAARHVETPWILLVDADCYVHPAGFSRAIALTEAEPELDGVMGVFEPDAPSGPLAGRYKNFYRHCEIAAMANPPHIFTSSCFLIRKDAYEAVGGFSEAFGRIPTEDNEFYYRLLEAGRRLKYLTEFSFTHDKPMGLRRLFHEDAERVEAIMLNLRGRLGARRKGFSRGERWLALIELASGLSVLVGALGLAIAVWYGRGIAAICASFWLASVCALSLVNGRVLWKAVKLHGPSFAISVLWFRAVEMAAAGLGMARAMVGRKNP